MTKKPVKPETPVIIIGAGPDKVALASRGTVFLPIIQTQPPIKVPPHEVFYQLLLKDKRQQHPRLIWDEKLAIAAQCRAAAQFGEGLSHCDQSGICANAYARAAGFILPDYYSANGNEIESLTAGTADAKAAFNSLARSPSHAKHLFGEIDFFREQDRIGIAMVEIPVLKYRYYWAILIAKGA